MTVQTQFCPCSAMPVRFGQSRKFHFLVHFPPSPPPSPTIQMGLAYRNLTSAALSHSIMRPPSLTVLSPPVCFGFFFSENPLYSWFSLKSFEICRQSMSARIFHLGCTLQMSTQLFFTRESRLQKQSPIVTFILYCITFLSSYKVDIATSFILSSVRMEFRQLCSAYRFYRNGVSPACFIYTGEIQSLNLFLRNPQSLWTDGFVGYKPGETTADIRFGMVRKWVYVAPQSSSQFSFVHNFECNLLLIMSGDGMQN